MWLISRIFFGIVSCCGCELLGGCEINLLLFSVITVDSRMNYAQVRYSRYPIEVIILVEKGQTMIDGSLRDEAVHSPNSQSFPSAPAIKLRRSHIAIR